MAGRPIKCGRGNRVIIYREFLGHYFVSGLRTLNMKNLKNLKNLKPKIPTNLKKVF